jgi:hypothetical protein
MHPLPGVPTNKGYISRSHGNLTLRITRELFVRQGGSTGLDQRHDIDDKELLLDFIIGVTTGLYKTLEVELN